MATALDAGKTGLIGTPALIIRKPIPPAQKGLFDG
jgi:hypothetical protein